MSKRISRPFLVLILYGIVYVNFTVMETHQVVPDLISEAAKATLSVIYDGGITVDNGAELTPTQVKNQPNILWAPDLDTFYTIIMVNPDFPSPAEPNLGELLYWLVVNIPGNDISKGDVLTEYIGSGPPKGTGLFRYMFLLYKQSSKMEFDEERISKTTFKGRKNFSTRNFVEKHNLGKPIAGNFFRAQYDEYVPELHKLLGLI